MYEWDDDDVDGARSRTATIGVGLAVLAAVGWFVARPAITSGGAASNPTVVLDTVNSTTVVGSRRAGVRCSAGTSASRPLHRPGSARARPRGRGWDTPSPWDHERPRRSTAARTMGA